MAGVALYSEFWPNPERNRVFYSTMEINGRYLFGNTQTRSFDLYNKEWSRYQSVYRSFSDAVNSAPYEGINVFTQRMHVNPGYAVDYNSALGMRWCNFELEVGANFWGRQHEHVSLIDPFPTTIALTSVAPAAATINRAITIREAFGNNASLPAPQYGANIVGATSTTYALNSIQPEDINLNSAAHPTSLSNTMYASLGYTLNRCRHPLFFGLGGSSEFASDNLSMERITVWLKMGISL